MKDYYRILEVSTTATLDEIKKSYRRLVLKYHPDRNPGNKVAEDVFKKVVEAYEVLSNEELRRNYLHNINRKKQKSFADQRTATKKVLSYLNRYKYWAAFISIILFLAIISTSGNIFFKGNKELQEVAITPGNPIEEDNYSKWDKINYSTGSVPDCFNFNAQYDRSIDNKLEVKVNSNSDAAIKLCSAETNKCIRYVYICSGAKYEIKNIPEGKYYLKIAYGSDWRQKNKAGKCVGKFTENATYEKGEYILDFNKTYTGKTVEGDRPVSHYRSFSYSLTLDVDTTNLADQFQTNDITEDEFDH